nr:hypothetical protein [Tanacetum cinerariifolium]
MPSFTAHLEARHPKWFSQPRKPPSPDRSWNTALPAAQGDAQSWISDLAKQADARSSFNELLDTPIDFSNFIMHQLNVDTLTPDLLVGPTYELIKGSCSSLTELEYHLEEVYKNVCLVELCTPEIVLVQKGNIKYKTLVPRPPKNCARCAKCGHPVNGLYCQGCALIREKLEEDLVSYLKYFHDTSESSGDNLVTYLEYFQESSESSDDSTNVVNAPRELFVVKQDHGVKSSQNPPPIDECCCECGEALDGIFCQQCICKSCGKGAHIGYNCPPKVLVISNPEPCNQTINNELPQTLPSFDSVPHVSKPNFVDESSKIFNHPPQHPVYPCEFCGNDAYFGHYCTPKAQFNNPEQGYSQDFNFPQNIYNFQQQYFCCEQCGGPHETFQCQQVNFYEPCCENCGGPHENFQCQPVNPCEPDPSYGSYYPGLDQFGDFHP